MFLPAALLIASVGPAASPANAQAVLPGGLYVIMIPTNCIRVPGQENLTNGIWQLKRVNVFAPGNLFVSARTVSKPDQVSFLSNNPVVIPPAGPFQLFGSDGGVPYRKTELSLPIRETGLRKPANVDVTATGSNPGDKVMNGGKSKTVTRKLRVYPRAYIQRTTVEPKKSLYSPGDRVQVIVQLPWDQPAKTVRARYTHPSARIGNSTVTAGYSEWGDAQSTTQEPVVRYMTKTFFLKWPDKSEFSGLAGPSVTLNMQVTLESMTSACAMVKEPNRVNLQFKLKNPSPGTAVRLPPESSRRRASDNVIDIKRRQKPDTNYTTR